MYQIEIEVTYKDKNGKNNIQSFIKELSSPDEEVFQIILYGYKFKDEKRGSYVIIPSHKIERIEYTVIS